MASKKYDLAVKTGSYTDSNGNEKGRYENVGAIWEGDNGPYLVMKRTFNPAGVPFKDGSDSIFISLFEPRQDGDQPKQSRQQQPTRRGGSSGFDDIEGDAPF